MEDSTIETEARILNTRRSALKGAAALLALGTLPVTTSGPAVEASSVNSPPPIEAGKEDVSLWGQILRLSSEVKEISRGGRFDDAAKNIAHLIAYCKTQGAVLSEVAADIQKRLPSYSPEIRCSCPDKERILAIVKDIGAGTLGGYLLSEGCSATDAHHSGMFVRASKNEDMLTIMLWGPTREDMEQYKDNSLQLIGDREFTQAFNKEYHHRQQLRERYFRV